MAKAWLTTVKLSANPRLKEASLKDMDSTDSISYEDGKLKIRNPEKRRQLATPNPNVCSDEISKRVGDRICPQNTIIGHKEKYSSSKSACVVRPLETETHKGHTPNAGTLKKNRDSTLRFGRYNTMTKAEASNLQQNPSRSSNPMTLLATTTQRKRKPELELDDENSRGSLEHNRKRSRIEEEPRCEPFIFEKVETDSEAPVFCTDNGLKFEYADIRDEDQELPSVADEVDSDQNDVKQVPLRAESLEPEASSVSGEESVREPDVTAVARPQTAETKNEDDETTKKNKYQCKYCDETFKKRKKLKRHIRHNHNFQVPQEETAAVPTEAPSDFQEPQEMPAARVEAPGKKKKTNKRYYYPCSCCNRKFRMRGDLMDHQNTRKGIKSHICQLCNAAFYTRRSLYVHTRIHRGIRVNCNICNKSFSNRTTLKVHLKAAHDESRTRGFQCDYCEKAFYVQKNLTVHIQMIHTPQSYNCDLCSKTFSSGYRYEKHQIVAHNGPKKQQCVYSCDQCKAQFDKKSSLFTHKKCHSN